MRRIILLATIAIALLARAAAADQPTQPESTANGILRVVASDDSVLANELFVGPIIGTKPLLEKAIANVSKEAAQEQYQVASVETKFDGGGIQVIVNSFDERVPADALLQKLASALTDKLRDMDVEHRRDEVQVDRLAQEVEKNAANLAREYEVLVELATIHRVSINAEQGDQKRMRLEIELQNLGVQSRGLKARQEVIQRQIAKLGKQVAEDTADDRVLKELVKSVELRKDIVATFRAKYTNQAVTKEHVLTAEDELAQAEAEVARFRAQAALQAGGQRIAELTQRLDDTEIEMAETSARSQDMEEQLAAMSVSSAVEIKRLDVERLKEDYRNAIGELSKLRTRLKLYHPPEVLLVPLGSSKP